jgi:hypothetical protein
VDLCGHHCGLVATILSDCYCVYLRGKDTGSFMCMGWDGPETSAPISYMLLKPPNIMGYTADFDWMYFGGWTHLINHAFLFLLSLTMFIFL